MNTIKKTLILLPLATTLSLGTNLPNSSTINKDIKVPKNIQKTKKFVEIGGIESLESLKTDTSGKTLLIKGFSFTGNTKFTDTQLKQLLQEYTNKELNFVQMEQATRVITKAYRDAGYFVARAYLPKQTLKDNILTIAIIEGKYGDFEIQNNSSLKDKIVQNIFNNTKKEKIISSFNLERAVLIANDTPGVIVTKADVKAGKKQGYSDFEIEVNKENFYDGYIILDNHGSRYTGENRLMAGLNLNSPLNQGDKLSLTSLVSSQTSLKYGNVDYNTLLHSNGLRGGIGYTYSKYKLIKEYKDLDSTGESKVVNLNLSYPIVRQRDHSLFTTLEFENKQNKDDVKSTNDHTKKELNVVTLGLEYQLNSFAFSLPATYNFNTQYTYGNLKFKDTLSASNDAAGANTQGDYSKLNLELSQLLTLTQNLTLDTKFSYQHALGDKNLDGSEDLSIGGLDGVKVYPSSEASGENGYIFSIEPKYSLPKYKNLSSTVGVFYDRAKVYTEDNSKVNESSVDLQDIGISYYGTYKDLFINSYMAWRLNSKTIQSEPSYNSKFLVQLGWVF